MSQLVRPRKRSNVKKSEAWRKSLRMHDSNIRKVESYHKFKSTLANMMEYEAHWLHEHVVELHNLDILEFPDYALELTDRIIQKIAKRIGGLDELVEYKAHEIRLHDVKMAVIEAKHLAHDARIVSRIVSGIIREFT